MRFDLQLRAEVRDQVKELAKEMGSWQTQKAVTEEQARQIQGCIRPFSHTTRYSDLRVGGVDGSGDFPVLSFADSFVYFAVAQATLYDADASSGLREASPPLEPVFRIAWIPEDSEQGPKAFDAMLEGLAGLSILEGCWHG